MQGAKAAGAKHIVGIDPVEFKREQAMEFGATHTFRQVGKGGTGVVTGMGSTTDIDVKLSLFELTLLRKRLQGAMFGGGTPRCDISKLLGSIPT